MKKMCYICNNEAEPNRTMCKTCLEKSSLASRKYQQLKRIKKKTQLIDAWINHLDRTYKNNYTMELGNKDCKDLRDLLINLKSMLILQKQNKT